MSKKSLQSPTAETPHVRAHDHLKKILKRTAAFTLGTACVSYIPMGCDPVPQPICRNNPKTGDLLGQGVLQAQAAWQRPDGGALSAQVTLHLFGGSESITFKGDPALSGAKIFGVSRSANDVTFSFTPDSSVTQVQAVIEIDCATLPKGLKLGFDVTAPAADESITVTSLD